MKTKTIKEQILELKKEKMIAVLQEFSSKKKIKWATFNPNSQYRSIYLTYRSWRKKEPDEIPPLKSLWRDKNFQGSKAKIVKKERKN